MLRSSISKNNEDNERDAGGKDEDRGEEVAAHALDEVAVHLEALAPPRVLLKDFPSTCHTKRGEKVTLERSGSREVFHR